MKISQGGAIRRPRGYHPNKKSSSLAQLPDLSQCLDPVALIEEKTVSAGGKPQVYVVLGLLILQQRISWATEL